MNFSLTALTAALAATAATAAPTRKSIKLSRNLRKNSPVTKALLRKATPYKSGRKLEDQVALDGSYNFKFSQCVDVKTFDEDNDANYAEQIAAGTVVPTKSYVIFHVCTDATCGYDGEDDLYIVDLPTYLGTVATFHAEKKAKYCEACEQFADVCNVQEEEEEEEVAEDADEEADGEEEQADEGENEQAEEGEEEREEERDGK